MKLVFTRCNTFQSYLIRAVETIYDKFEGGVSQWSHVACMVTNDAQVVDSMRERGGVTAPRSIGSFLGGFPDNIIIDVPVPNERAAEAFLLAQVGKGYDIKALWGFVVGEDIQDPDKWYCYELVYCALLAGGLQLPVQVERITCNRLLALVKPYEVV